jgi:DnaJ family protein C protein 7
MRNLFNSKKSPKKHATGQDESQHSHRRHHSNSSLNTASGPSSPVKSPSSSPTKSSYGASPASPAQREFKAKASRTFARQATDPGSSSSSSRRGNKHDPHTHPLNLHPDEYKRLSALSAMSNRSSFDKMDVDKENSANPPSSPPTSQSSYTVPINTTNGAKESPNGAGPAPPPHRSNPSSPVPSAADEAEEYKAAGNKFFKDKDYKNAIIQYSKGN